MLTQLLTLFLEILLPVFAIVLVGYFIGPRLEIDARSISRIAYYILVPAFLFNLFSTAEVEVTIAVRMTLYILAITVGCAIAGFVLARLLRRSAQMTSVYILIGVFGNVGNFGFPIIEFRLGEEALVPAAVYFLVITVASFIIGVGAATWNNGGSAGAVLAVFKTPAVIAFFPAFLVNWWELPVPLFAERSIALLAGALIPVMLLTLGVQLSRIQGMRFDLDMIAASGVRLLIGPILALLLAIPFGLAGIERGAGILQAGMPAAVLASLIAIEHDLMPDFVTTAVLFSTIVSGFTLTIFLALV